MNVIWARWWRESTKLTSAISTRWWWIRSQGLHRQHILWAPLQDRMLPSYSLLFQYFMIVRTFQLHCSCHWRCLVSGKIHALCPLAEAISIVSRSCMRCTQKDLTKPWLEFSHSSWVSCAPWAANRKWIEEMGCITTRKSVQVYKGQNTPWYICNGSLWCRYSIGGIVLCL